MASLTESSIMSDLLMNTGGPQEPKKNEWYDRVYLCWEDTDFKKPTTYLPIKGFNCYRFNSFEGADYAWNEELECKKDLGDVRHTMIPICKWVPERYDYFILNYKLMGMYWLGNHLIGRGYNKFDK
jgi:hypothetical protein